MSNVISKRFAHFGWYVGIKKTGRGKNGRKTWYPWGQKAIRFVARKPYQQPHPIKQITNRHGLTLVILNDGSIKGNSIKYILMTYFYADNILVHHI